MALPLDPSRKSLLRHYRLVSTLGTALAVVALGAGAAAVWRVASPTRSPPAERA